MHSKCANLYSYFWRNYPFKIYLDDYNASLRISDSFFNPARLIISILHSISKIMIIREKLPVGK